MGKDIELAILCADVVGSTRLYEQMGDLRARDMVAICIDVMRSATEQRQGTVIKTMGDEVMATFPSADEALNAAAQMQQQISTHAQLKVDNQPVSIRIGCHFGPVVLEARDVFGATVHFVDEGVDSGPVILQRGVELPDARDAEEVLARVHEIEHVLLPEAVRLIAAGRVRFDQANARRVLIDR